MARRQAVTTKTYILKMKDVGSSNGEMMRQGRVEVICGSMFSGKTEELIRRLRRAQFAHQRVEIFKPAIDVRYSEEEVVSHEGNSIMSTPVDTSTNILLLAQGSDVVGIDEAQFLDDHIVEVCNTLAGMGIRVIVAGLDLDFKGQPFGPMPALCAIADEVTKVHAICVRCGALAYVSHRTVAGDAWRETRIRTPLPRVLRKSLPGEERRKGGIDV